MKKLELAENVGYNLLKYLHLYQQGDGCDSITF